MKKAAKSLVVSILAWQVKRLYKKNQFKVVGVVGSIGKTSTKLAIARVLSEHHKVQYQEGNYNEIVSVPLIFFGHKLPSLFNPFAWLSIFIKNESQIAKKYPYEVVVLEIGTDFPGQIAAFKKYLHLDIAVVTALTPEHMMYFSGLSAVAEEELSVAQYSKRLLLNVDLCPKNLTLSYSGTYLSYALKQDATYTMDPVVYSEYGTRFTLNKDRQPWIEADSKSFSEAQLYSLTAAAAVADLLEVPKEAIEGGFAGILPVAGRMQLLQGLNNSTIIDDTYNASPDAVKGALDALYRYKAIRKIALLGNMNELGAISAESHAEVGKLCVPSQLFLLITLGPDANEHLAAAAEKNGCKVARTHSPVEAAKVILEVLEAGDVVLVKGSQNGVYAEEAVKMLLENKADTAKLVRQSKSWIAKKQAQFKEIQV